MFDPRTLDLARHAARAAARACLAVLARSPDAPAAMEKLGREPVTVADYASQALVLRELATEFPRHAVVAEEGVEHFAAEVDDRTAAELIRVVSEVAGVPVTIDEVITWIGHRGAGEDPVWAIDPIDGTKGFLRRDQFAVAVGVLWEGSPMAGVLACPHFDPTGTGEGTLYWGEVGGAAYAESLGGGALRQIGVSAVTDPAGIRVLGSVESAHGDPALVTAVIEEGGLGGGVVRIDSQVKYGAVADGLAEVYLRPRNRPDYRERIWDHAAGAAIVAAAGGRVTDLDGRDLDFTAGSRLEHNRGVVATNGAVHEQVLAAVRAAERRVR